jgi:hypothetical protein
MGLSKATRMDMVRSEYIRFCDSRSKPGTYYPAILPGVLAHMNRLSSLVSPITLMRGQS